MKLKEDMRFRQQRDAAGPRPAHEAMTLQIEMIVSNWYVDEHGNQARFITARDYQIAVRNDSCIKGIFLPR
jgi:hypothetical protein